MQESGQASPGQILARGAARGVALEDFVPIWETARLRLGRVSWSQSGLEPFLTYDVPYTGTSSGRLSEDAVAVFLASASSEGPLRILELGSGSGVFARLFLDRLRELAPETYARTSYLVTDGSETVLAAQIAHGVLDAHADRVETRVLDATGDWSGETEFDAILGTYIMDSLPFDLLAVNDRRTWRKEGRSVVEDMDDNEVQRLRAALDNGAIGELAGWTWIGPRIGLQTRHVPIDREQLAFGDSLPDDTGGQTIPFVHCHGALTCLDSCRRALRKGGVAIFSDYGHLKLMPRYEYLEFQAFGNSVAVGVNFSQLTAAAGGWSDAVLHGPVQEEGNLLTRVLLRAATANDALQAQVDHLYGADRYRALNDPLEKARAALKSRYFETARALYREALVEQPDNWAIMEETASALLMTTDDYEAVIEMADQGLARNPLAPGLWLARAEALLALGRRKCARAAIGRLTELAPGLASSWRVLAELECGENNHGAALDAVAAGLKHDRDCDEQEALLKVQSNVLAEMAAREHQRLLACANQFRALDGVPE